MPRKSNPVTNIASETILEKILEELKRQNQIAIGYHGPPAQSNLPNGCGRTLK